MSALHDELEVRIACTGSAVRVHVAGELDLAAVPTLGRALAVAREAADGDVEIDLAAARFCDSAGLCALLAAHHDFRDVGRTLRLVNPGPAVVRVLELTGTSGVFDVRADHSD